MKVRNPAPLRPERQIRGISSGLRAGVRGVTVRDGVTDVHPVLDIKFQGATVTELDDDTALVTIGGAGSGGGGGGPGTGGDPGSPAGVMFQMLNNSGQDLALGDVVVVDDTADRAVTVTTTEGDTHIVGVVQEVIPEDDVGTVLFNGYAPVVNATGITRGEYAKTSTSAAVATSTADREAGSFAVYLTGDSLAEDFITDEETTTAETPVMTLAIDMPATLPVGRQMFLALWLEAGTSSVSVAGGWALIGAESGFYYYTREAAGGDTATASWTTASTAVATVLVLHPSVVPVGSIEAHDYDTSTSAAAVSGLSDAPRYAIAGVDSDEASPGSGFVRLGGGSASFASSGTPTLVQSKLGSGSVTFDSTLTTGSLMVAIPILDAGAGGGPIHSTDPRQGGVCPQDSNMTKFDQEDTNNFGSSGRNGTAILGKIISGDTYSGPFGSNAQCAGASNALMLLEFENIGLADYEVATANDSASSPVDCGTFTVGSDDLVIMAVVGKADGYGGFPDPTINANGFTQVLDAYSVTNGWAWIGYKVGDGDASITFSDGSWAAGGWAAVAVHLTQGTQAAEGTLAGKYIGHDSSATSPFSGSGQADDALFAINLTQDAKPSALLYGPDLGGAEGTSVAAEDVTLADAAGLFTAADVEAAIAELAKKAIGYQAHGSMGAAETFSALTGWHSGTFDADCTFTFSGATSGIVAEMVLELTGDGTHGATYPGSVVWPGGVAPDPPGAGETVLQLFVSRNGGATWYGNQAGGSGVTEADVRDAGRWEPVTNGDVGSPEIVFEAGDVVMEWVSG